MDIDKRNKFMFFSNLSQVAFTLSGHLGHNFRSIDQEEKSTGLISHSPSNQSLTGTGGAVQKDTPEPRTKSSEKHTFLHMFSWTYDFLTFYAHGKWWKWWFFRLEILRLYIYNIYIYEYILISILRDFLLRLPGWLDTEGLEKCGVTEGKLNHLTDLCHLPSAPTDIIITHIIQSLLVLNTHTHQTRDTTDHSISLSISAAFWWVFLDRKDQNGHICLETYKYIIYII